MLYFLSSLLIVFLLFLITFFNRRELSAQILVVLLHYGEMPGLQIIDAIKDDFGYAPGFGSLYPVLRRLERNELIKSRWGEERPEERGGARRKYYRRTGKRSRRENPNTFHARFRSVLLIN
mgnify:CR=1 FL=1